MRLLLTPLLEQGCIFAYRSRCRGYHIWLWSNSRRLIYAPSASRRDETLQLRSVSRMTGNLTTSLRRAVVGRMPIPMRKLLRRVPLLAQAKLYRWGGRPWVALDAAMRALSFASPSETVTAKILRQALQDAACAPHW